MDDFIVGYTYAADIYCPEGMHEIAVGQLEGLGVRAATQLDNVLNQWARAQRVARADETSFDSDYFPKEITRQMAEHAQGWAEEDELSSVNRCACHGRNILAEY